MNKTDPAEIRRRVDTVADMLIAGAPRHQIHAAAAKLWDVSIRTADRYITQASTQISAETAPKRASLMNTQHARLERVWYKSFAGGDYRAALGALKQIAQLYGLDAPTRTAIDLKVDTVQLDDVLAAIEQAGLPPALVFNNLIAALAAQDVGQDGDDER